MTRRFVQETGLKIICFSVAVVAVGKRSRGLVALDSDALSDGFDNKGQKAQHLSASLLTWPVEVRSCQENPVADISCRCEKKIVGG